MRHLAIALALMFGAAHTVSAAEPSKNAEAAPARSQAVGMKLAKEQCAVLWSQADSRKSGKLSEQDALVYLTDPRSVNTDGDTTIEQAEFEKACASGLIKQSAASIGAATTTGSTTKTAPPSETSDRTPEKMSPTPPEQMDSAGGKTSDRTPEK